MKTSEFYDLRGEQILTHSIRLDGLAPLLPPDINSPYRFARKKLQPTNNDGEFLEVGCGTGLHSFFPTSLGYKVTGIDLSEKSIEAAKLQAKSLSLEKQTNFIVLDATEIKSFSDQQFACIFMSGVLYYLDLPTSLVMFRKKLKENGQLICIETLGSNPFMNIIRRIKNYKNQHRDTQSLNHLLGFNDIMMMKSAFPNHVIQYFDFLSLLGVFLRSKPKLAKAYAFLANKVDWFLLNKLGLSFLAFKFVFIGKKT